MANQPKSVDPGKTPGSAEGGAFDNQGFIDQSGKTPGAAEGAAAQPKTQGSKGAGGYVEGESPLDRQKGDPPA